MKIKAVCEATGLSDRAIRYYIDERLVAPACTENYLGRRSFDFTEADVKALNSVSMLRKYGFSVSEIRTMIQHPDRISETTQTLLLLGYSPRIIARPYVVLAVAVSLVSVVVAVAITIVVRPVYLSQLYALYPQLSEASFLPTIGLAVLLAVLLTMANYLVIRRKVEK